MFQVLICEQAAITLLELELKLKLELELKLKLEQELKLAEALLLHQNNQVR